MAAATLKLDLVKSAPGFCSPTGCLRVGLGSGRDLDFGQHEIAVRCPARPPFGYRLSARASSRTPVIPSGGLRHDGERRLAVRAAGENERSGFRGQLGAASDAATRGRAESIPLRCVSASPRRQSRRRRAGLASYSFNSVRAWRSLSALCFSTRRAWGDVPFHRRPARSWPGRSPLRAAVPARAFLGDHPFRGRPSACDQLLDGRRRLIGSRPARPRFPGESPGD